MLKTFSSSFVNATLCGDAVDLFYYHGGTARRRVLGWLRYRPTTKNGSRTSLGRQWEGVH